MNHSLTLLMLCIWISSHGQIVSDQTNSIVFNGKPVNTVLPEITWEIPRTEYSNSAENGIQLKAKVESTVPLKSVILEILKNKDDNEIVASKRLDLSQNGFTTFVDQRITLSNGQNWVRLRAENEEGGIVVDYRSVLIGLDAITDAIAIDRKDYALLFGIDKYDYWNDLVNPVYDVNSIASELQERYGFETEVIENAVQEDVFIKLREYAGKKYRPQDQLLIFFAGHGQYDETFGEGYVVARNSLKNDPAKTTYITHNRLREIINNFPVEHVFLVMDVCFGGTFDPVLAGARSAYDDEDRNKYLVRKLSKKTRKYLTSGSKEYVSDGIVGQHSPFAQRFIQSLKSNGGEDRILILDEIRLSMEKLQSTPRFDGFGSDELGSDFVFVAR